MIKDAAPSKQNSRSPDFPKPTPFFIDDVR